MAPVIAELRKSIQEGDVLVPGDGDYLNSLERWSATCVKPAAIVVRPKNSMEASLAVRFATSQSIPLVVLGGGHNPSGGSATTGGMVIDLKYLRSVHIDEGHQSVTFGGGCVWKDVDTALWQRGYATVGGTLMNYIGEKIANIKRYSDLFWALRGAGQSFGVVTSFTSRIFPQGEVWGGIVVWPLSKIPDIVAFINEFDQKTDGDQHMLPMLACHPKTLEPVVAAALFYNGDKESAERFYQPILGLQKVMDQTAIIPYPQANTFPEPKTPFGKRYTFSGANFICPLGIELVEQTSDMFHELISKLGNEEMKARSMIGFELAPQTKLRSVATSQTAFAGREGTAYNVIIVISWDNEAKDTEAKRICADITSFLKENGWKGDDSGDRGGTYYNYLNPMVEEDRAFVRADRVFGPNVHRLRELKAKYDPTNVFKKAVDLLPSINRKPQPE
ncbi:FAD binding domain protein [Seiridium cupressi]